MATQAYRGRFTALLIMMIIGTLVYWGSQFRGHADSRHAKKGPVVLAGVADDAYDVVIAHEVLSRAGYTVVFEELPWARCLLAMKNGNADVLANVFHNAERQAYLYYVEEPFLNFRQHLYSRRDTTITFDGNLDDLQDFLIGARIGFSYGNAFDDAIHKKTIQVDRVSDAIQNTKKLIAGRIDLMIENPINLILDLRFEGEEKLLSEIRRINPPISNQPSFVAVSKRSAYAQSLVADMDRHLREMKRDGTYQTMLSEILGGHDLVPF